MVFFIRNRNTDSGLDTYLLRLIDDEGSASWAGPKADIMQFPTREAAVAVADKLAYGDNETIQVTDTIPPDPRAH